LHDISGGLPSATGSDFFTSSDEIHAKKHSCRSTLLVADDEDRRRTVDTQPKLELEHEAEMFDG
jgi:hypothetical protein